MELVVTDRFRKNFYKLSAIEQKQTKNKIELLQSNMFHPSLRTKKIKGGVQFFESSVNMDIRIIWYYDCDKIILADIGHHKIIDLGIFKAYNS